MSTSKNHTIRYVIMIFPALSIILAKTFSDWMDPSLEGKDFTGVISNRLSDSIICECDPLSSQSNFSGKAVKRFGI